MIETAIRDHEGKFCGVYATTQKKVHNAKIVRVTPCTVLLEDRNEGNSQYRYYLSSLNKLTHRKDVITK